MRAVTTLGERPAGYDELRARALDVLCAPELAPMVEMVVFSPGPDVFEARTVDGMARFGRRDAGHDWHYRLIKTEGRDPLADQDPTRFSPLAAELAELQPDRRRNSYPLAYERIAQVFDHPCAPDLCVLHTAAHRPGTHRGEHGSLDVVQSRAPFIASGPGVRNLGLVAGHCRLVDVAPTVLALLGLEPGPGVGPTGKVIDGLLLARQDGRPLDHLVDPEAAAADQVVVVLMDGANANVLYESAANGLAPNLGGLIERGSALAHGAVASLPTVTLANHTSLNTGAHPGHHGVLHNAWYDRSRERQVVTESPTTWQEAMRWLFPGVETIHEALHRHRPDALSVAVNEPADRGADYSTFDLFRRHEVGRLAEGVPNDLPTADPEWLAASEDFRGGSLVDSSAVNQARRIWGGEYLGTRYPVPTFTWVSFSLTDAAFHQGGPHSPIARAAVADTDARLGEVLTAIEARGALDSTAVLVVADHGMEENAPDNLGDWSAALSAAGVVHRDEASGFIYLGVGPEIPSVGPPG